MCTLISKVQNNKTYLECIFSLSCWEERHMKEKCVLKHSFNTGDGEGQICVDEQWMLQSDIFELSEIEMFMAKIQV